MSTDQAIEKEIQAKNLNAPRVTPQDVEAEIRSEVYFTANDGTVAVGTSETVRIKSEYVEGEHILAPLSQLTFCVLVLRNGFTVTGESACASPANFDAEIGRKIARQNAVAKIWPLLGFRLRDRLAELAIHPARKLKFVLTHPTCGDEVFCTMAHAAVAELASADPGGTQMQFDASNGVHIDVSNLNNYNI